MNAKHRRFISEYLKDHNGTRAAKRAGYSKKTSYAQGYRLLRYAEIRAEIARREAKALEKNEISLERWLEELRRLMFSNMQDFFDSHGNLKPIHELTREQAAAISGCETIIKNARAGDGKTDEILKLKFWDKPKALELAGKHMKWLDRLGESDAGDWEKLAARLASIRQEGPTR